MLFLPSFEELIPSGHIVRPTFEGTVHQNAHREIPIGCVRRDNDDDFRQFVGVLAGDFPAPESQYKFANPTEHVV